jgi:hypothetical protein
MNPGAPQSNHAVDGGRGGDRRAALLREVEKYRLPPELKEQILAELPPPEERERLLRELMETGGGLSAEEFFASLGLEIEPQP